jgi:nitrile hydratase
MSEAEGKAVGEGQRGAAYRRRRALAIISLLKEKGVVTQEEIQERLEDMERWNPGLAARAVARAWVDPEFKARLLRNAGEGLEEVGIDAIWMRTFVALENTDEVHNMVVCTLCSCYPRALLGLPPTWYKSLSYRSRLVVDPRGVLEEFGLVLDPSVEVRVYDSTADMRCFVIPKRPPGTEDMTEEELIGLITRNSMIGVAQARLPGK